MTERLAPFDEDFLRKLELLSLVSRKLLAGKLRAEHRARRTGAGQEFADFRGYVPGDDFRKVDWRSYLKLGRLILRLFEEEADLPVYIFVDTSRSMALEDTSKLDYARRVAAALAYVALSNLDPTTLVTFADGVVGELSGARGKGQIFDVFRFLAGAEPTGKTDLERAVRRFFTARRRRGLVVLISDFLDPSGFVPAFDVLRFRKHDVLAVQVFDPEDLQPPIDGEVTIVDIETREERRLRASPALLEEYAAEVERYGAQIERYCSLHGFGFVRTVTEVPFEDLILQVFRQGRFLK